MPRSSSRTDSTPEGQLSEAALAAVLGYQIAQASVVANRLYERAVERPLGLHRLEFTVLLLLRENSGCTAAKMAKALGISPPNMVLWLDRLTGRQLVQRMPSPTDRRSNHLQLTAEGLAMAERARTAVLAAEAEGLHGLSTGERLILAELLHKVARLRPLARPEAD